MSALLDELKSVLNHFRGHVAEQVNSGALVTIDRHLATLETAAQDASTADQAVRGVLGELYGTHPAQDVPAEAPAPAVETPAPVAPAVVEHLPADSAPAPEPAATVVAEPAPVEASAAEEPLAALAVEPQAPEAAV